MRHWPHDARAARAPLTLAPARRDGRTRLSTPPTPEAFIASRPARREAHGAAIRLHADACGDGWARLDPSMASSTLVIPRRRPTAPTVAASTSRPVKRPCRSTRARAWRTRWRTSSDTSWELPRARSHAGPNPPRLSARSADAWPRFGSRWRACATSNGWPPSCGNPTHRRNRNAFADPGRPQGPREPSAHRPPGRGKPAGTAGVPVDARATWGNTRSFPQRTRSCSWRYVTRGRWISCWDAPRCFRPRLRPGRGISSPSPKLRPRLGGPRPARAANPSPLPRRRANGECPPPPVPARSPPAPPAASAR